MVRRHQLTRAFGEEVAEALLPVLNRELTEDELMDRFEVADKRYRECYCPPGYDDMALHVADFLIGSYGIEGWATEDGRNGVSYCNMGDPYTTTIVHGMDGEFHVQCWANLVR